MTQDKIGNQLSLDTADFWSTCKMGLVIYLTVPRISREFGGGIKQSKALSSVFLIASSVELAVHGVPGHG